MEPNSRAGNMASGTNATNYNNVKELIRLVKYFQKKEDLKEGSHNFTFISSYSFIFLYQANFIKSFCKGQLGCVFPDLFSYFTPQTEQLNNIHCISKGWKTFTLKCWFPVCDISHLDNGVLYDAVYV